MAIHKHHFPTIIAPASSIPRGADPIIYISIELQIKKKMLS